VQQQQHTASVAPQQQHPTWTCSRRACLQQQR
jgi:hypothetical protein